MGKKLTLKQLQNYATSLGGKCLSPEYINIRTKIHWQCAKGHTWWAQFDGKSWCMPCRKKESDIAKRPMFYKELKDIAEIKWEDLNAASIDTAINMIEGTAKSMGLIIKG